MRLSTCWPVAPRISAPTVCCASICCMCCSCRWFSFSSSLYIITKSCISASACRPRKKKSGQDTANKVPADRRVYYLPDVAIDEIVLILVSTALMVLISAFYFTAPLETIANPQVTPLHTVAPWYFYWLQGLLKIADKTIAGVVLPGVLLVLLDRDSLSGSKPQPPRLGPSHRHHQRHRRRRCDDRPQLHGYARVRGPSRSGC